MAKKTTVKTEPAPEPDVEVNTEFVNDGQPVTAPEEVFEHPPEPASKAIAAPTVAEVLVHLGAARAAVSAYITANRHSTTFDFLERADADLKRIEGDIRRDMGALS